MRDGSTPTGLFFRINGKLGYLYCDPWALSDRQ
jgi:hypothetical protein